MESVRPGIAIVDDDDSARTAQRELLRVMEYDARASIRLKGSWPTTTPVTSAA
jgi:hypothetical protein